MQFVGLWQDVPAYPIGVVEANGGLVGEDLVIFSGFTDQLSKASVKTHSFDMSNPNAQWIERDDLPSYLGGQGLTHTAVAVHGQKLYTCGGVRQNYVSH